MTLPLKRSLRRRGDIYSSASHDTSTVHMGNCSARQRKGINLKED